MIFVPKWRVKLGPLLRLATALRSVRIRGLRSPTPSPARSPECRYLRCSVHLANRYPTPVSPATPNSSFSIPSVSCPLMGSELPPSSPISRFGAMPASAFGPAVVVAARLAPELPARRPGRYPSSQRPPDIPTDIGVDIVLEPRRIRRHHSPFSKAANLD